MKHLCPAGLLRALAGLLSLGACSDRLVRLPLPPEVLSETTRTLVVTFEAGAPPSPRAIEIIAEPSESSVVQSELTESDGPLRVTLLGLSATPAQLGLDPGPAPLASGIESHVLIGPAVAFEATLEPQTPQWVKMDDPLDAKARARIEPGAYPSLCRQIAVTTVDVDLFDQDLVAVAVLPNGSAVMGGGASGSGSALVVVSPDLEFEVVDLPTALDEVQSLVVGDAEVYGITDRGRLFAMDLVTHRIVRTATSAFEYLAILDDDRLIAWSEVQAAELSTELRVVQRRPDLPIGARRVLPIGGRAMLVMTSTAIHRVDDDGRALEHCCAPFDRPEITLFGGERAWASSPDGILERDPSTRRWAQIPKVTEGISARGGARIGPDLVMVGGARGVLALWNGRSWCSIPSGTFRAFTAVAIDAELGRFYAVTWNGGGGDRPALVRGNLPLLR